MRTFSAGRRHRRRMACFHSFKQNQPGPARFGLASVHLKLTGLIYFLDRCSPKCFMSQNTNACQSSDQNSLHFEVSHFSCICATLLQTVLTLESCPHAGRQLEQQRSASLGCETRRPAVLEGEEDDPTAYRRHCCCQLSFTSFTWQVKWSWSWLRGRKFWALFTFFFFGLSLLDVSSVTGTRSSEHITGFLSPLRVTSAWNFPSL